MTEAEWLACTDPAPMLEFLRGKAGERKLRLFACACARSVWGRLHGRTRAAIQDTEVCADGNMSHFAYWNRNIPLPESSLRGGGHLPDLSVDEDLTGAVQRATTVCAEAYLQRPELPGNAVLGTCRRNKELEAQAELLRCVCGNPFRASAPLPPAVLAWNDSSAPRIAQAVHEERQLPAGTLDTTRLAILADALLDAGCDDEALIHHCRSAGPHVRGCWAIDLILGKE